MTVVHSSLVFADYFQFIVQDEASDEEFGDIWTPEALEMALATGRSAISLGTLRNVEVFVEIHVHGTAPTIDPSQFDHAVEASISLPTGTVVVMGCTGYFPEAPRFRVPPGDYRLLSLMQGTDSIVTEWEPADDKYILHLWPGELRPAKLIKHWRRAA